MKKLNQLVFLSLMIISVLTSCTEKGTMPEPYGALPTDRQLAWHEIETYAFLHFTTNTFTGVEWGYGDEKPEIFNPSDFNADQIIGTLAKTGFKGAIITAKHHDGFCLWPSKFTGHSVKNSPWKDGNGDVVREIAEACKKYGIKFGVYLSPWDRNFADYGNEKYIEYYQQQLTELLTEYGDIFMVWFDGANGGDGYYGGAREVRKIDRSTYYDWDNTIELVRKLQPNATIFGDAGPDVRWIGNERGVAKDSCWATYTPLPIDGETKSYAGTTKYWIGETGTMNGEFWMPAEADVSIRPGWFYHQHEDDKVKSLEVLLDIYFRSVGNGTSLNLNIPPDQTGQIHYTDSVRLVEFKTYLDKAFANNLLKGSKAKASNQRGSDFGSKMLTDDNTSTFWATEDLVHSAIIEFQLKNDEEFNCILLQEYIRLGQRITDFSIEIPDGENWKEVASASTIGYKKLLRFETCKTNKIRINIKGALACPTISEIKLYNIEKL